MALTQFILLASITFFAAMTQSITGFGFALLTLPFFLLILDVQSAVQLTQIATLLITISLIPFVYQHAPKRIIRYLAIGSIAGFPLGLFFLNYASNTSIQLFVGMAILIALALPYWSNKKMTTHSSQPVISPLQISAFGLISGIMTTSIAMPGPGLAFYAQRHRMRKIEMRATIIVMMAFSYAIATLLQLWMNGLYDSSRTSLGYVLAPAFIGTYVGNKISNVIPHQMFTVFVNFILLVTAVYLLATNVAKLLP